MIIEFDHSFVKNCLIMGNNVLFYSGCLGRKKIIVCFRFQRTFFEQGRSVGKIFFFIETFLISL